jgi:hypothetical protein
MWYKTALTVIDPTGQINFPDMGGHKFNLNDYSSNLLYQMAPKIKLSKKIKCQLTLMILVFIQKSHSKD